MRTQRFAGADMVMVTNAGTLLIHTTYTVTFLAHSEPQPPVWADAERVREIESSEIEDST